MTRPFIRLTSHILCLTFLLFNSALIIPHSALVSASLIQGYAWHWCP